jgi:hypothetical protein
MKCLFIFISCLCLFSHSGHSQKNLRDGLNIDKDLLNNLKQKYLEMKPGIGNLSFYFHYGEGYNEGLKITRVSAYNTKILLGSGADSLLHLIKIEDDGKKLTFAGNLVAVADTKRLVYFHAEIQLKFTSFSQQENIETFCLIKGDSPYENNIAGYSFIKK